MGEFIKNEQITQIHALARIGVWYFDLTTEKITWSNYMYEIFLADPKNGTPTYEHHRQTIHPEDFDRWATVVNQARKDGKYYQMEFRIRTKDGTPKWVFAIGEGVRDVSGNLIALHGSCQDITEAKLRTEKQDLEKLRVMEIHKQTSLGTLATNLAHEINNPLTIISGSFQMLEREFSDGSSKVFSNCHKAIERITSIIKTLQYFSHSHGGGDKFLKACDFIPDLQIIFGKKFEKSDIKFHTEFDEDFSIYCPKSDILNVFLNLINNSLRSLSRSGGSIEMKGWMEGGKSFIKFSDSGAGIPYELRDRVFDSFFTTQKLGEGLGLGLAITKKILIDLNADIFLESNTSEANFILVFNNTRKDQSERRASIG